MENAQLFRIESFFLIPYGFNTNLNTDKFDFEHDFFKFVEMRQIIYGWKDIKNTKLSHVEHFLKFTTVEE